MEVSGWSQSLRPTQALTEGGLKLEAGLAEAFAKAENTLI